jgi:hypothetical protein
MKKSSIGIAIALALGATGAQAVTFNFDNSTAAGVNGTDFNFSCNTSNFLAGREFRMCDPSGALGGGLPLQKNPISGGEQWLFNAAGAMTGVTGTAVTGGLTLGPYGNTSTSVLGYIDSGAVDPSSDRFGGPGLDQGANFFGNPFGFLAPYIGSDAVTPNSNGTSGTGADIGVGVGQYTATGANTFEVHFDVLEAQWSGAHFMLGQDGGAGVTFYGTLSGTEYTMWAEELIDASEDKASAGFAGWTAEWYYHGTLDGFVAPPAVPVPAAVWLFGSGLLGLVGVARRKKSTV